jgi:uncharacterized repeat protein (TIGR03803 family)
MTSASTGSPQPTAGARSVVLLAVRSIPHRRSIAVTKLTKLRTHLARLGCILFVFCIATTIVSRAQTFTILADFDVTDGSLPRGPLAQGPDGNIYGTTSAGGSSAECGGGCGTVFRATPEGVITTLYSFCIPYQCPDGDGPVSGLVLASDGNFYGTTPQGSPTAACPYPGCGTIFRITPEGALTTLYTFCSQAGCLDGSYPIDTSGLTQGADGNLYGTTENGGNGECYGGCGTIFKISLAGKLSTLYNFCPIAGCTDGYFNGAGVVEGANGDFYGTTFEGGSGNGGTFYTLTTEGNFTTLYSFCHGAKCLKGAGPTGAPVQGANGNFYGSANYGGAEDAGALFEVTPPGAETTLYTFCKKINCADGQYPDNGLTLGSDGNFYGATSWGGVVGCYDFYGCGTIFRLTSAGEFVTIYSFCDQAGCGYGPGNLTQATSGIFYGTTPYGGIDGCEDENCGTVFSLSMGLGPFVHAAPTTGRIGSHIIILGNNLKGTTSVTFNGAPATFTVASDTEITTTVPAGASTGTVAVTTGAGTMLNSNVPFRVMP